MFASKRKGRGFASAFGLALVAVLACSAFVASAAQASPAWHIEGKTLAERGETEAPSELVGNSVTFDMPGWGVEVECSESFGWGYLVGADEGNLNLTAFNCTVPSSPKCNVTSPIHMQLDLGLSAGGGTGVLESFGAGGGFATLVFSGKKCSLNELEFELYYQGSQPFEVAQAGKNLSLSSSSYAILAAVGEEPVYITFGGTLTQSYYDPTQKLEAW